MSILPFTMTFLIVLLMASSLSLKKTTFYTVSNRCFHLKRERARVSPLIMKIEEVPKAEPKASPEFQGPNPAKQQAKRGPYNKRQCHKSYTRFDLLALLRKEKVQHEMEYIFENLIRILYGKESFYDENLAKDLLSALRKEAFVGFDNPKAPGHPAYKNGKRWIREVHEFAELNLKDARLQEGLYKMLKGQEGLYKVLKGQEDGTFPSLCDFVTLTQREYHQYRINMNSAPQELIQAVFNHDQLAEDIVVKREELRNKLAQAKKNPPNALGNELKELLKNHLLPQYNLSLHNFEAFIAYTDQSIE